MTTAWDSTVDFVIAGSGGGGMVAALTAADAGASALLLEKQERIGGSTAMSGGIVWIPNNPLMQADGVPDSYEDAMAHFEAVVAVEVIDAEKERFLGLFEFIPGHRAGSVEHESNIFWIRFGAFGFGSGRGEQYEIAIFPIGLESHQVDSQIRLLLRIKELKIGLRVQIVPFIAD
jgi:hypothetical protein